MSWPQGSQPYNFFAGAVPEAEEPLAYIAGYYFVITSVIITLEAETAGMTIILTDGEGNRRLQALAEGANTAYPSERNYQCEIVLGNVAGATVSSTGGNAVISVDGYGFPPQNTPIW